MGWARQYMLSSALRHGHGERQEQRVPMKIAQPQRAHVLPMACASGRSRTSSRSRSRRYADHALAQSQSSARSPSWFDGDVRMGATGRVTPTFLSTSFTTARARSTWKSDHDGHLHPRTSVVLLVVAMKLCGCSLSPETHIGCSEPPARVCNRAWLAQADYTVKGETSANNLLLLSRLRY